jgi:hypothetical protein
MADDHPSGEVRPVIVRDVLDATETQGASVGMRFCAASATGLCHRSLANRFGTADHQHPEPANGESRIKELVNHKMVVVATD